MENWMYILIGDRGLAFYLGYLSVRLIVFGLIGFLVGLLLQKLINRNKKK